MNIAVISFDDVCVDEGMAKLIDKYGKTNELNVFLPVTGSENHFAESVVQICKQKFIKVTCFIVNSMDIDHILKDADDIIISDNPVKEIIRQMTLDDVLGIVWDDSPQAHFVLHAVEDFGLDIWDISEGLDPLEIDYSELSTGDLYEEMMGKMHEFVSSMAEYVTSAVVDALSKSIDEHIAESENGRDISPFDDDL